MTYNTTPAGTAHGAPNAASPEDLEFAKWAHLTNILAPLGPLVFWVVGKDKGPVTRREAAEALNFGITIFIVWVVASIVGFVLDMVTGLGLFTMLAYLVPVLAVVFGVIGFLTFQKQGSYRYPFAIRFIK